MSLSAESLLDIPLTRWWLFKEVLVPTNQVWTHFVVK
jgi:hypothetical protein